MVECMHPAQNGESSRVPLVDVRAARLSQGTTALLVIAAALIGSWPLLLLPTLHLAASLALGPRGNVAIRAFNAFLKPRLGPGALEDARPPRFANMVGVIFLGASLLAHAAGITLLGWILAWMVGALALLAAATGLCIGCQMYRVLAPLRGIRPGRTHWFDLAELGAPPASEVVVEFTHPLCSECIELDHRLSQSGRAVVRVDVSRQPELARKYRVTLVPLAYAVRADGTVLRRIA